MSRLRIFIANIMLFLFASNEKGSFFHTLESEKNGLFHIRFETARLLLFFKEKSLEIFESA